jgi:hypothetical protein
MSAVSHAPRRDSRYVAAIKTSGQQLHLCGRMGVGDFRCSTGLSMKNYKSAAVQYLQYECHYRVCAGTGPDNGVIAQDDGTLISLQRHIYPFLRPLSAR